MAGLCIARLTETPAALVVAGASPDSSDPLRNIYLLSASYIREPKNDTHWDLQLYKTVQNATRSASLDMRVGFFSICVRIPSDPDPTATQWHCAQSPDDFQPASLEVHDPLALLRYGAHFAHGVVFYGLL